jgi:GAF domain-containing protein
VTRPGTANRKRGKARRRKTTKAKPGSAPMPASRDHSSVVDLQEKLDRQTRELNEAHEPQAATSEVLEIIGHSTFDLQRVLESLLEKAVRLCGADRGLIFRQDGDVYRVAASCGHSREFLEKIATRYPITQDRGSATGRAVVERRVVHIHDILADPEYRWAKDHHGEEEMHRTILAVPMMRQDKIIGVITIRRVHVQPFTVRQIALVSSFAAQAVIAIENTRLLNELRESLDQQTATSELLGVISRSSGDLGPVFESVLANATRICGAKFGGLFLCEGDAIRVVAFHNAPNALAELWRREPLLRPGPGLAISRSIKSKQVVQIADIMADQAYLERDPARIQVVELGGFRAVLSVPLVKDNEVIGAFNIFRQEPGPFTDKQIALATNFAAQAVIAIENTRLLNELRQRTADLTESLEQQTATSQVLQVISSSPGELQPVFDTMLENALRICEAKFGVLFRFDGTRFHPAAGVGTPPEYSEFLKQRGAFTPAPGSRLDDVMRTKQVSHSVDHAADAIPGPAARLGGARSTVEVPMLKDEELIGAFVIYRLEVRPFTDKQIALLQNFAAQAVIAIENARLLGELRQSLDQQTATADVLKIISRSTFDLKSVLQTLVESAAKLCDADMAATTRQINGVFYRAEFYGFSREFIDYVKDIPIKADRSSVSGRALLEGRVVQIPDVKADPEYTLVDVQKLGAFRTALGVPMLREGVPIGVLGLTRSEVRPFTDKQIELVTTFADQAVIAIENARLLSELRQRTDDLTESLAQQTATADVLKVISRSTFDLRAVLQTLVESAARFCAADKATVIREKDGLFYSAEAYGYSREFLDYIRNTPIKAERGSASGRALVEGRVVHIPDVKADPEYTFVEALRLGDFRTALCVPMLREGVPIGVLTLTRSEVKPFTDKQIELVTAFADQAAIAIENVRLFDEIQDKSRQLEEASQHKSQFLANMSHELRTPLNAILGYTELMADGAYGEPSEKMLGILKRLESNGKHLLGLINDVLDLSKIEAGQLVLELSDYSVQDIAQTVRSTLEPLAADKKLAFKVEMAGELPPGHGDGRRLTQVLINLVGNAIKFTDAGEVAIKAEAHNGSFHVAVRDTGPGISSADQARLFQEFQQADNAITRKKGGTGLGLAISKRIIEMHGGRIWVESQPGQGSTFTFTLPVIVERQVEAA